MRIIEFDGIHTFFTTLLNLIRYAHAYAHHRISSSKENHKRHQTEENLTRSRKTQSRAFSTHPDGFSGPRQDYAPVLCDFSILTEHTHTPTHGPGIKEERSSVYWRGRGRIISLLGPEGYLSCVD